MCLSRPLLHVSVPESTTLRSVLVRTTDSRAGQDRTRKDTHISLSLNARGQSDDAPLHVLSLYFLFLSTSLEPSQRTTT